MRIDFEKVVIWAVGIILFLSLFGLMMWCSFKTDVQVKLFEQRLDQKIAVETLALRMK